MSLSDNQISSLVEAVVKNLQKSGTIPNLSGKSSPQLSQVKSGPSMSGRGIFADIDQAVAAARQAQLDLMDIPLKVREAMIAEIRKRGLAELETISQMAVSETQMGRVSDKINKNMLALTKTPGTEDLIPWVKTGDDGLTLEEWAPYGVIGAITPTTNATETLFCNGIGMLAAGNAVTFNVHPRAKKVSAYVVAMMNDAVVSVGGPDNLLTLCEHPTIESAQKLMKHPDIRLLVVTGGPAVVQVAMNSGKKVIAAGPGNPPVVVDETADIKAAGRGIVNGATLDNNIVCIAEKEIIVVDEVADMLKKALIEAGSLEINKSQIKALEKIILKDGKVNTDFVGKNANVILSEIGIKAGDDLRMVLAETEANHPFVTHELLMPVLPLVRVRDVDEGIALAKKVEDNCRHTAAMHSTNITKLHKMARVMDCSIFVKNAPTYAGLGLDGEGYCSFTIASPTGEGLTSARDFARVRRCTLKDYFRIV
jgi:acyl-CoA reductase-like NAD-dependent aldehyde dehydrogenase